MDDKGRACADRSERRQPPGDFTSDELREDTARFLDESRRRAEKRRRQLHKQPGPPPKDG